MSVVAVIGAGPIGGAVAHALAIGSAFREVRLIDAATGIAEGKALDIRQSGPIDRFDTIVRGEGDVLAACSAAVIVIADAAAGEDWDGERGLGLVGQLMRAGTQAPIVFAGAKHMSVMEAAARELGVPVDRMVGSAAAAMAGAARALTAAEANGSAKDVAVSVVGRPPGIVVAWSSASIAGASVSERIAPHRLVALTQALRKLWPCGPQAIGAATAEIVAGLAFGSRRQISAMTVLDGELGVRRTAAMLPVDLGGGRVRQRLVPTLSPQERTELLNSMGTGLFSTGFDS
jgi:malate dehydrogenase